MMICAVIDTNVLVSALITHNPQSATSRVVRHLLDGDFVPLYDGDIVAEYADVLHRKKFKLLLEVADSLISFIIENGVETDRTTFGAPMPDEDDRVFYEVSSSQEYCLLLVVGSYLHPNHTDFLIALNHRQSIPLISLLQALCPLETDTLEVGVYEC